MSGYIFKEQREMTLDEYVGELESSHTARNELIQIRAEIGELKKKSDGLLPCVDCEGLFPMEQMTGETVDPDSAPVCPPCVDNFKLKQQVERAEKDFGIAAQQVLGLKGKIERSRIAAMTCRATLKLILQDTQESTTATHLKPAIENLNELIRELKEAP